MTSTYKYCQSCGMPLKRDEKAVEQTQAEAKAQCIVPIALTKVSSFTKEIMCLTFKSIANKK